MMKRNISKWLIGAATLAIAVGAVAAPYRVTYSDTASDSTLGINSGEQATIELVLDNGNSSAANQTWTAADVQCVVFTFNNAQNLHVAIDYSASPFTTAVAGDFTTNVSGVLQTAPTNWTDDADPIANPVVTNIGGSTPVDAWWINGVNEVLSLTFGANDVTFTNVGNNIVAADWSNPVPASGVCAAFFPSQAAQIEPVPTLTRWGTVLLSCLLVIGIGFSLRRRRQ